MTKINKTISVDKDIFEKFVEHCKSKAMKVSTKLNLMMKEILKQER